MARTNDLFETGTGGTYIQTIGSPSGYDILINGANHYLNFNALSGSSGYGIRDNGGTIEFKDYGGTWASIGSSSMVYPTAGIPLSTGTGWSTSITNNSTDWNTAYSWGNHALAGYELQSNKSTSTTLGTSDILYPTQNAVKTYADNLVAGLLDYRGAYDASGNVFPSTGGSGAGGAVKKGDMWIISVPGTLGGTAVQIGDSIIASVDSPTSADWNILNANISYVPEDQANKVTSISGASTDVQYPSAKLTYDQLALKANLSGGNTFTGSQTFDTTTLFVDSVNHRVGIGTTSPLRKLEVYGSGNQMLINSTSGAGNSEIAFATAGTNAWRVGYGINLPSTNFEFYDTSNSVDRMVIGTNGNVGIGTTSPNATLDIAASLSSSHPYALNVSGTGYQDKSIVTINNNNSTDGGTGGYYPSGLSLLTPNLTTAKHSTGLLFGTALSTNNSAALQFYSASSGSASNYGSLGMYGTPDILVFNGSGNVGIGTSSPGALLQVGNGIKLNSDYTINWGSSAAQGKLSWVAGKALIYGLTGNDLSFGANGAYDQLYIKSGGNVGIGTTTPGYSLDVLGLGSTNGVRSGAGFDINPVKRPPAFTVALAGLGAGNVNVGTHYYYLSYQTALGDTELSTGTGGNTFGGAAGPSVTTTSLNGQVNVSVTASTDPRVTGIKIYRTNAGGVYYGNLQLVTTLPNTTQVYVDNIADSTPITIYASENKTSKQITVNSTQAMFLGGSTTSLGNGALVNLTTGGSNTIIGAQAGQVITTGSSNVLVGYGVGANAGNPNFSIGIGQWALYSSVSNYNIAIGHDSFFNLTSNSYNTGVGGQVGFNTTGSNNTFFGMSAGYGNTTGSNNINIGYRAGYYETAGNTLLIDSLDRGTLAASRTSALIYGLFNATPASQILSLGGGGSVGINTISPTARLHLPAGTATASTAPLKLTAGVNLTTPEAGAMEFDGTDIFYTTSTPTRRTVANLDASQTLTNKTLTTPTISKPVMSATNPTAQTYTPLAAGTATLDLSLSNFHFITMPAGNITIALSNDTNNQVFMIRILQDATGSRTVTWFSTIKWDGGTAPTLTTTASKADLFGFVRTGTGTYDGFVIGQNI